MCGILLSARCTQLGTLAVIWNLVFGCTMWVSGIRRLGAIKWWWRRWAPG